MALKRMVNGVVQDLTAEEETKFLADQKAIQDQEKIEQDNIAAEEIKKASGKQKLKDLGLDDDEIKALMGA
jgi:hypothetical protein